MSGVAALLQTGCCCGSADCPMDCSGCGDMTIVLTGFDAALGFGFWDGTYELTRGALADCTWTYSNIFTGQFIRATCVAGVWTLVVANNGDCLFTPGCYVWKFTHPASGGCLPTGGWTQIYCPSDLTLVDCPDGAAVSTAA